MRTERKDLNYYQLITVIVNMINELRNLVRKLKKENAERSELMNRGTLSDYNHTVKVHTYNNTLDIIKQIESIIGNVN